jgi:hypothetical protein
MTKSKFWNQLAIFIIALLAILSVREYFSHRLIEKGIDTYQTHTFFEHWSKFTFNTSFLLSNQAKWTYQNCCFYHIGYLALFDIWTISNEKI